MIAVKRPRRCCTPRRRATHWGCRGPRCIGSASRRGSCGRGPRPRGLDLRTADGLDPAPHCFVDQRRRQVHATLLDEGTLSLLARTMYRLLDAAHEIKERRDQVRRPTTRRRVAGHAAPNEVWELDITACSAGEVTYFYLYVA